MEDTNINITELKEENSVYDKKLKEYDDFLTTIDIEDLLEKKKEYDNFKQKYDDTVNAARLLDTEYKTMSKKVELLDEVPCGTQYPMCQFIRDAHLATVELPSLEVEIIESIEEAKIYKTKVVSVNSGEMIGLIQKYNDIIIKKNNIEIEKRDNKVSIEKLYAKIKNYQNDFVEINTKIDLYEEKKDLIKNIEKLLSARNDIHQRIEGAKDSIFSLEELINQQHRHIGSMEQKVESLKEKKEELLHILN